MVEPDFKTLIELSKESADMTTMDPAILRKYMDETSISMQSTKIEIRNVKDVVIKLNGRELKARIYDDNNSDSAIIYYHGGKFLKLSETNGEK